MTSPRRPVAPIAAVPVGMEASNELRIAASHGLEIGVFAKPENRECPLLAPVESRLRDGRPAFPETARNGVERVGEVGPGRRRIGARMRERPSGAVPARIGALRVGNLVGAHALEEIILRIMLAHMLQAQESPGARTVEIRRLEGRLEFARLLATGDRAPVPRALNSSVQFGMTGCHHSLPRSISRHIYERWTQPPPDPSRLKC
jgi:hypothetical protein